MYYVEIFFGRKLFNTTDRGHKHNVSGGLYFSKIMQERLLYSGNGILFLSNFSYLKKKKKSWYCYSSDVGPLPFSSWLDLSLDWLENGRFCRYSRVQHCQWHTSV